MSGSSSIRAALSAPRSDSVSFNLLFDSSAVTKIDYERRARVLGNDDVDECDYIFKWLVHIFIYHQRSIDVELV